MSSSTSKPEGLLACASRRASAASSSNSLSSTSRSSSIRFLSVLALASRLRRPGAASRFSPVVSMRSIASAGYTANVPSCLLKTTSSVGSSIKPARSRARCIILFDASSSSMTPICDWLPVSLKYTRTKGCASRPLSSSVSRWTSPRRFFRWCLMNLNRRL